MYPETILMRLVKVVSWFLQSGDPNFWGLPLASLATEVNFFLSEILLLSTTLLGWKIVPSSIWRFWVSYCTNDGLSVKKQTYHISEE